MVLSLSELTANFERMIKKQYYATEELHRIDALVIEARNALLRYGKKDEV